MAMIGSGFGANSNATQMFSSLGLEWNTLQRAMEACAAQMPEMLHSMQSAYAGIGRQTGNMRQSIAKAAFISALHQALDKAGKNPQFNLETAINDLWIHLDAVRRFSAAVNPVAIDGEAKKLQGMMQKRAQLFSVLGELMKLQDQAQTSVIRNLR